nr:DNA-formamidopyrimidine glycosylase family protein [Cellulomonas sp. APG4]
MTGRPVVAAELRWPDAAGAHLDGVTVTGTESYGKHLFTHFDDGRTLHTHLRMEGSWRLERTGSAAAARAARSPWVRALLTTPSWTTVGHRLGMLDLVATAQAPTLIAHLGPDVLADDFPARGLPVALARLREHPRTPIAEALLDQTRAAGFGTIYMAESLFARRIWPWTPVEEIDDLASLVMTGRVLMLRSVDSDSPTATGETVRGATTRVHGRRGRPCRRCATPVREGTAGRPPTERPVFWCPRCQPEPEQQPAAETE